MKKTVIIGDALKNLRIRPSVSQDKPANGASTPTPKEIKEAVDEANSPDRLVVTPPQFLHQ
jgi:hypothetical protein